MGSRGFDVRISGYSDLKDRSARDQPLSEDEKSTAHRFGLTEEQYRRSKLAFAEQGKRLHDRAVELGGLVERILAELGDQYRLIAVNRNLDTATWRLEIDTPDGARNVVLSWELANDVLDSRTAYEFNRLRNFVLFGIGRDELIFQRK